MKQFSKLLFLLCFCCQHSIAQKSPFGWKFILDGYTDVDLVDLAIDKSGNIYAAYNYTSDLTIPGLEKKLPYAPHVHSLIVKLNKHGKPLWAHPFKSSFDNRINDIALAPNGDLLVTGFGDGLLHLPSTGGDTAKMGIAEKNVNWSITRYQGLYAVRYNPDGKRVWSNYFNTGWGEGLSIATNKKNETYLSFYFQRSIYQNGKQLDSIQNDKVQSRLSLAKFDAEGKLLTIKRIKDEMETSFNQKCKLKFDGEDNLIMYGLFHRRIDLTEKDSLVNDGYYESLDSYIAKYSPTEKLLWAKKIGGQNTQWIKEVAIASDNSIYAAGQYDYECAIGNGITIVQKSKYEYKSNSSMFYLHLLADGELDFVNYSDDKAAYIVGAGIALDNNNSAHIIGYHTGDISFGAEKISTKYDISFFTAFYSVWKANKNEKLTQIFNPGSNWNNPVSIDINANTIALGGSFYGDTVLVGLQSGKQKIIKKDYGRAAFVVGGFVEAKEAQDSSILITRKYLEEKLLIVRSIAACSNNIDTTKANVWLNIDTTVSVKAQAPCGSEVKGMGVLLYPNPATQFISLKFTGIVGNVQLDIFSESGQLVLSNKLLDLKDPQTITLDVKALPAGNYAIRVLHNNYFKGLKLIKQ